MGGCDPIYVTDKKKCCPFGCSRALLGEKRSLKNFSLMQEHLRLVLVLQRRMSSRFAAFFFPVLEGVCREVLGALQRNHVHQPGGSAAVVSAHPQPPPEAGPAGRRQRLPPGRSPPLLAPEPGCFSCHTCSGPCRCPCRCWCWYP